MHYVGVLDGSGNLWGVRVPDLPGCVGAGSTPEEALVNAAKALRDVIAHKTSGAFAVPKARSVSEVVAAGEIEAGEAAVLIPLLLDSGRTVRANVTFDAGLLEAIDEAAQQRGLTRSAFLASAAREKIEAQR
jgi:predicted RNase H-like HicB family nuclease